jgi:hypothetical protein
VLAKQAFYCLSHTSSSGCVFSCDIVCLIMNQAGQLSFPLDRVRFVEFKKSLSKT